jgi:hypothetical protein
MPSDLNPDQWISLRKAAALIGVHPNSMPALDHVLDPIKVELGEGGRYGRTYLLARVTALIAERAESSRLLALAKSAAADVKANPTRKARTKRVPNLKSGAQ